MYSEIRNMVDTLNDKKIMNYQYDYIYPVKV